LGECPDDKEDIHGEEDASENEMAEKANWASAFFEKN
jgi:hypothetical protein